MFGAGARDAEGVSFLECIAADQLGGDLAGERDHGNGVHHGIHQAGYQVGCAWTGGGAADSHASGGTREAFRGERGILFVTDQNMPDGVIVEGVVQRQRYTAWIAENAVHVFANQAFQ